MESRYLLYRVVQAFRNRIRQNYMLLSNSYSSTTTVVSEVSNSSPETTAAADDYVEMTDACIRRIKQLHNKETLSEGKMLRLSVEAGGCSGFQYVFQLDDKRNPDDMVFEKEGVKLIVDNISYDFVKGATVDYAEELIRSAFLVTSNPSAVGGCSCQTAQRRSHLTKEIKQGMSEIDQGFVRHSSHRSKFLEECYLCKAEFDGKSDIFMFRGEMGFCSEECRNEKMEIEEEKERTAMKKMKASSRKKKAKSNSSGVGDKRVAVQYANTTAVIT